MRHRVTVGWKAGTSADTWGVRAAAWGLAAGGRRERGCGLGTVTFKAGAGWRGRSGQRREAQCVGTGPVRGVARRKEDGGAGRSCELSRGLSRTQAPTRCWGEAGRWPFPEGRGEEAGSVHTGNVRRGRRKEGQRPGSSERRAGGQRWDRWRAGGQRWDRSMEAPLRAVPPAMRYGPLGAERLGRKSLVCPSWVTRPGNGRNVATRPPGWARPAGCGHRELLQTPDATPIPGLGAQDNPAERFVEEAVPVQEELSVQGATEQRRHSGEQI